MENRVYKLKQEYPGSPKEGTIVMESYDNYQEALSPNISYNKEVVENYPKNWELQEMPEFIVISIISPNGYIRTGKQVMYEHAYGIYPDYKVHTIKRTSDGEEFSIGDVIVHPILSSQNSVITKLEIQKDRLIVETTNSSFNLLANGSRALKNLKKFKQPTFEVLSFLNEQNQEIYMSRDGKYFETSIGDKFSAVGRRNLKYCLEFYKIQSLRRLSDGEVFKIGSKVNFNNLEFCTLLEIQFEIAPADKGTNKLCFVNDGKIIGKWWDISQLSNKVSLFKTEDGVDIFEGDTVFYVFNELTPKVNSGYNNQYKVTGGYTVTSASNCGNDYYKVFSTKEKAEEYIKMNKPEFSRNKIISLFDKLYLGDAITNFIINELDKK